jgi:hypothetical protein
MIAEVKSSGDIQADLMALLFEKSQGDVGGVLELVKNYPLFKIKNILSYWSELTKPQEQREQDVQEIASKKAEEARKALFENGDKIVVGGLTIDKNLWGFSLDDIKQERP